MQPTREVPLDVFEYLRAGYVEHRAHARSSRARIVRYPAAPQLTS